MIKAENSRDNAYMLAPLFSCSHITKKYEGVPVVEDVTVELPAGGFVSLVGPSGVGKTTLFNVLSGVDRPDEGSVFLGGEDVSGVSGHVAYMLQKDLLLDYRTALDNVILPLLIRGRKKKEAREYAASFFPRFGLEGSEKKYPRQLSGGMRQRAALLRTWLQSEVCGGGHESAGRVILLDEPFSALDAITRRQMQEWYAGLASAMGISTLFITHDVEEALLLSDTVYVMNGVPGKIVREFTVAPARPREKDFQVSSVFASQKKEILEAVANISPIAAGMD